MVQVSDMSFKEQMQGFPWQQILVISLVRLAEPVAFSSLFTYAYYMVEDLGVAHTKAEVAKYAGFLASSFAFCQVLTGVFWGRFADRNGRKPTIIFGLCGSIISVLIFGFAKKYWVAFMARCLMGILNGNVAVVRTMLGEVAKEKKHQALAFSVIPLIWNLGCVIGPLVGGYLSGKETSISFMKEFVMEYPYARPNIVIASMLFFSVTVALLFLEDTHYAHKYRHDYCLEIGDKILAKFSGKVKLRPWQSKFDEESEESIPLQELIDEDTTNAKGPNITEETSSDTQELNVEPPPSIREVLTVPIFSAVFSIFINAIHVVVCEEFTPVFVSTPVARDDNGELISKFPFKLAGGLSYTTAEAGFLLSSTGMFSVTFIILVLPHINRKFGTLTIYRMFSIPLPFIYFAVPFAVLLGNHLTLASWMMYAICVMRTMCYNLILPQLNVMVHTSSPPKQRAFVNGISISFSSAARCAGPFIWGFIMTAGQAHDIVWLGWWAISLLACVGIYYSKNLTDEDQTEVERAGEVRLET
uniref:MFS transporter n=1 Tax=Cyberlindnera americana TaxID=36016 RepID=A0A5P8N8K4_9ASCO|nr:MFS transporter [Cyberlindnera americana]